MKYSIILMLSFLLSGIAFSQSADSTGANARRGSEKKQKMDRFIDEDGDGICDRRAEGLGFGRQKKMHGKKQQAIKTQQGATTGSQGENKGSRRQAGKNK